MRSERLRSRSRAGDRVYAYSRRMPRMQVYLPEDVYTALKSLGLPASEMLQNAVRAELRRRELLAEADRYVAELVSEVGEPSAEDRRWAAGVADKIASPRKRSAG